MAWVSQMSFCVLPMEYFAMAGYNKGAANPAGTLKSMKNPGRNPFSAMVQELTAARRRLPRQHAISPPRGAVDGIRMIANDQPVFPLVFTG
jgi:hypothetical protein